MLANLEAWLGLLDIYEACVDAIEALGLGVARVVPNSLTMCLVSMLSLEVILLNVDS